MKKSQVVVTECNIEEYQPQIMNYLK